MPIYEYRCDRGHSFEVLQRMTEEPLDVCTTCAAPAQRVLHPVAVHFKGSGFYSTDYGSRRRNSGGEEGGDGAKKDSPESTSEAKSGSTSDSKSDSGSAPKT